MWNTLDAHDRTTLSGAYLDFSPNRGNGKVNCIFSQMNVSPTIADPASGGLGQAVRSGGRRQWGRAPEQHLHRGLPQ